MGENNNKEVNRGEVEEMASFGIFLRLAFLCFFIVRYADSYGYNRGYHPYNRGYNPYNRGYYNRGYNPYNKAGAMDTRSTKLWIQQRIQQLQRIKQGYKCKCSC